MTCHNERVTRSRRHAEAKRNKSSNPTKKDRDPLRSSEKSNVSKSSSKSKHSNSSTVGFPAHPHSSAIDSSSYNPKLSPPLANHPPNTAPLPASRPSPSSQSLGFFPTLSLSSDKNFDSLSRHGSSGVKPVLPTLPLSDASMVKSTDSPRPMQRHGLALSSSHPNQRSVSGVSSHLTSAFPPLSLASAVLTSSQIAPPSPPPKDSATDPSTSRNISTSKSTSNLHSSRPRGSSISSELGLQIQPPQPPTYPETLHGRYHQTRPQGSARPATADGHRPLASPAMHTTSPLSRTFESSPQLPHPVTPQYDSLSPKRALDDVRHGRPATGLAVEKAANRRSGFYGPARGQPIDEQVILQTGNSAGDHGDSPRRGLLEEDLDHGRHSLESSSDPHAQRSLPSTPPADVSGKADTTQVSDRPMSYYDPEVLFFLDAVGNGESSARLKADSPSSSRVHGQGPSDVPTDADPLGSRSSTPEMEHFSHEAMSDRGRPSMTNAPHEGKDDFDEVTRRVRASMSLNTDTPNTGGDMSLDVGLVEQLLSSLQNTKERMKTLQEQYNAMKRASTTAFQGFSLAREEYDREVAARHEAESKMRVLKSRMLEQASRLTEIESLKSLEQESQQLRHSVTGLQKHLSQLVVERDLRVAEVEALQNVPSIAEPPDSAVSRSLSAKLDAVRQDYRKHIDELVIERDRLKEEVDHLSKVRKSHVKELESLNQRQDLLAELNSTAMRQLEETRANLVRFGTLSSSVSHQQLGARSVNDQRSLLAATHSPSSSQQSHSVHVPDNNVAPNEEPLPLPADVTIATTRKFKWGKTQRAVVAVRPHGHKTSASVTAADAGPLSGGLGTFAGGSSTGSTNGVSGSANSHLRPHNFQPVSALRPVRCDYCGDKLWGLAEVRCTGKPWFSCL